MNINDLDQNEDVFCHDRPSDDYMNAVATKHEGITEKDRMKIKSRIASARRNANAIIRSQDSHETLMMKARISAKGINR